MRLDGKVSIITGGGSGMGRVAAELFAREGSRVVVADFSEASGQETVDRVNAAGGHATFVRADVSSEDDARSMVQHAVATYGRVDTLYNNAGIMPEADHSVVDTDVETWDRVMAINVRGVFLGCKYAIPAMLDQGSGSIINIASFVAILGCSVPQDAYTASKGAVLALTRSTAVQFAGRGVRSNAISPGPTETEGTHAIGVFESDFGKQLVASTPLGRAGQPSDIAPAAVFLASDAGSWITGESIRVSGGAT